MEWIEILFDFFEISHLSILSYLIYGIYSLVTSIVSLIAISRGSKGFVVFQGILYMPVMLLASIFMFCIKSEDLN